MKYRHEGILVKHAKNKPDNAQILKAMTTIMNPPATDGFLKDVVLPKPKRPYKPRPNARKPHVQHEMILQKAIIDHLRLHGCICGTVRVEARLIRGVHIKDKYLLAGVPDLIVFNPNKGFFFVECKWGRNDLSEEQALFKFYCNKFSINHIVARSIEDVKIIIDSDIVI